MAKTEHLSTRENPLPVKLNGEELKNVDHFKAQSEGIRGHYQTGSDVWEQILGDEGDQQEEDCYHGDEDASRDPRSVETRSRAKRRNPTHSTRFTDRRGDARWPSSLVWTCPET